MLFKIDTLNDAQLRARAVNRAYVLRALAVSIINIVCATTLGALRAQDNEEQNDSIEYTVRVNIGKNLIANQVVKGENRLEDLIPTAPIGTTIFFFEAGKGFTSDVFLGEWMKMAKRIIHPGQGFVLSTRLPFTLKLRGQRAEGSAVRRLEAGQHLIGSQLPDKASFASVIGRAPMIGEELHKGIPLGESESDYAKYEFTKIGWKPERPKLEVGEAAWFVLLEPSDFNHE